MSTIVIAYAQQAGREELRKNDFYDTLEYTMVSVPEQKIFSCAVT